MPFNSPVILDFITVVLFVTARILWIDTIKTNLLFEYENVLLSN